jgi:acyl-coenzyme A synthetase/AMP-(fatty) acid ligase
MKIPFGRSLPPRFASLADLPQVAARRHPSTPVFLAEPLEVCPAIGLEPTHGDLADLVRALSSWLEHEGVQPGQTIAICKQNNFDIVLLACAVAGLGAIPALFSPTIDPDALRSMLDRLRPDAAVVGPACRDPFLGHGGFDCLGIDSEAVERFRSRPSSPRRKARAAGDVALITHTSGTTGCPKFVAHSGSSLYGQVRVQIPLGALAVRQKELLAGCLPWFHVRSVVAYMGIVLMGNPVLAISDPEPTKVKQLLLKYRPRYLEAYPYAFEILEGLAADRAKPLASVRLYLSTFDAAHPRTIRTLLGGSARRFPIYAQIYGQSELGGVSYRLYSRRSIQRRGRSVGRRIWPYTKLRIVDPVTRRPVPAGEAGAIQARSVGLCLTYLGQEDLAETRRQDGWWEMGDMGRMSRFGTLQLLDRAVDRIPGVESCLEVEDEILDLLPCCSEAVIVARRGTPPIGVLTLKAGVPWEEGLWKLAADRFELAPAPLFLQRDEIPRTATGKVRRRVLEELVLGRLQGRPESGQVVRIAGA